MQLRIANEIATAKIRRQNRGDWRWKYSRSGCEQSKFQQSTGSRAARKKSELPAELAVKEFCGVLTGFEVPRNQILESRQKVRLARGEEAGPLSAPTVIRPQINVERLKDLNHARRGRKIEKSLDGEDSTAERGKERLISVLCWIIFGQYEKSRQTKGVKNGRKPEEQRTSNAIWGFSTGFEGFR
ncbi:hypothetical protein B0H13DRAFT_1881495 [Mycena leptocephala]|nr:hypothetical protein B0H13DRAFT_1881495 [Mycena leptocephala]